MAVGTVSSLEQDNWQLIATNTPSAAASSTFSSISGYKKLMLAFTLTQSTNDRMWMRFNGDTTVGNYGGAADMYHSYGSWSSSEACIPIIGYVGEGAANSVGQYTIDNVNLSIPKTMSGAGSKASVMAGVYLGSAITSILVSPSSGTITGTIYLYGIAA